MTDPKEYSSTENGNRHSRVLADCYCSRQISILFLSLTDHSEQLTINILRIYSTKLADATERLVPWLASELCSEGLLDTRAKDDLLSTNGVPAHEKALQLWSRIEIIVKFHENPDQALLTVCNVMKQQTELAPLAQAMSSQLRPHGKFINNDVKQLLHEITILQIIMVPMIYNF